MKGRNVLMLVLVLGAVGFGFYRGWFILSSPSPAAGSNQVNVNLATDTGKMKEDAETVKDKATDLTGKVTKSAIEPADQKTDKAKANDE